VASAEPLGLHEFLTDFIAANNALGVQLQDDFLMTPICVEHSTAYSYSEPLLSSTQYLRMTPLSGRTQTVESWKLSCPRRGRHRLAGPIRQSLPHIDRGRARQRARDQGLRAGPHA